MRGHTEMIGRHNFNKEKGKKFKEAVLNWRSPSGSIKYGGGDGVYLMRTKKEKTLNDMNSVCQASETELMKIND